LDQPDAALDVLVGPLQVLVGGGLFLELGQQSLVVLGLALLVADLRVERLKDPEVARQRERDDQGDQQASELRGHGSLLVARGGGGGGGGGGGWGGGPDGRVLRGLCRPRRPAAVGDQLLQRGGQLGGVRAGVDGRGDLELAQLALF